MRIVVIPIELCRPEAVMPQYARPGDAGMDVRSMESMVIFPGDTKIIPTGIKVAIPEGYEIQIRPRSGLSLKTGLRVANSPGTIDSGYRDEIGVIIHNTSFVPETITKGDRIAQLVLQQVPKIVWLSCNDVSAMGSNRGGGFGSTGQGGY